jgi:protein-S-isoprenylcysteine O-methyltransferase Ste14
MKRKNLLVTILFTLFGGPGPIGIYIPAWITRWHIPPDGRAWRIPLGCLLITLGLIPLFESIVRFVRVGRGTLSPTHTTQSLVVSGLYRYVRNPMYLGILTLLLGQVILFSSKTLAEYLACVAIGINLFVLLHEEPTLRARYGAQYTEFCRNVPRWIPRTTPWTAPSWPHS